MSFSFAIMNGDLVNEGSRLAVVTGTEKIKQELSIWLLERFGCDRFVPRYGSVLDDFVGTNIDWSTETRIHAEVNRVISNYLVQKMKAYRDAVDKFTPSEMLDTYNVIVKSNYDTIDVMIRFSSLAGQEDTFDTTLTV